jgi:hypothetical protein
VFLRGNIIYHLFKMSLPFRKVIPFDRPANYQIRVQGMIDPNWSDLLQGMTIGVTKEEGGASITTLEGELSDQTALAGVLNTIYELHLPVLSVVCQSHLPASDPTGFDADNSSEETNLENKDKENTT